VHEHYLGDLDNAYVWYTNSGTIEMIPKEGYGGNGLVVTLNVRVYFDDGNSSEDEWWTCNVTEGSPPYPSPCY
jgi:hypothetical protein